MMEKWVHWIPSIYDRFKLNFDGLRINDTSALGWVIRNSNGIIKMVGCKHLGKSSIIIIECITLRYEILAAKNSGYSNLEIEGDSKIIIDSYNKSINIPNSIILLMEDTWKLSYDMNIYECKHVFREANRTVDCLANKGIGITYSKFWLSNFPKDVTNISFEDYCESLSNRMCRVICS